MTLSYKHRSTACFSTLAMLLLCLAGCSENTPATESAVEWMDPNKIQPGQTQHDVLPDELLTRIRTAHATFADVDGTSLEKWIDDFKRDLDPEGNISIWEDMQVAYNSYCHDRELPLETRKEVFKIVLMRSMMPDEDVLERLELKHIPADDVQMILDAYPGDAKPIDVIQTGQ